MNSNALRELQRDERLPENPVVGCELCSSTQCVETSEQTPSWPSDSRSRISIPIYPKVILRGLYTTPKPKTSSFIFRWTGRHNLLVGMFVWLPVRLSSVIPHGWDHIRKRLVELSAHILDAVR
jgi:hypothetical protein